MSQIFIGGFGMVHLGGPAGSHQLFLRAPMQVSELKG